mmetsp:Transcript_37039/g.118754  ORF Transcript_37039/g.118754 Transcript_37039/m.118754 type:complete len:614 (-) Transcript_37039:1526-3367(-)
MFRARRCFGVVSQSSPLLWSPRHTTTTTTTTRRWEGTQRTSGLPEFVEQWTPRVFRSVGWGLAATSGALFGCGLYEQSLVLGVATASYWRVGVLDLESKQTLRRNFPVLIHVRYLLESIRPEIQQYFVQRDDESVPFSRAARSVVYQRAKDVRDTVSLGTRRDVYAEGHEWANHSLWNVLPSREDVETRVLIGGYSASLLNISAMSFGALSEPAIQALNDGAKKGEFYHNTGEGGISKHHLRGADVVWNVGTAYFACGVNDGGGGEGSRRRQRVFSPAMFEENASLPEVKMIEIKLSQGAKPAHGGILPASKITPAIAEARNLVDLTTDVISPATHTAFSSPAGLVNFVDLLRRRSAGKPVGVKLCVGDPVDLAALIVAMVDQPDKAPDFLTIDGSEGGTGAAPPEFQDSIGMPLAEGLSLTRSFLDGAGLRNDVKIIASGKIYDGFSLCRSLALGADLCNSARGMMFALGCIQALKCNTNKCPTGITTQDPRLHSGLDVPSKADRVANFHRNTLHSTTEIMAAIGARTPRDVRPEHFFRRENGIHVKSYADMHADYFAGVPPGSLLDLLHNPSSFSGEKNNNVVPRRIRAWWLDGIALYERTKHQDQLTLAD